MLLNAPCPGDGLGGCPRTKGSRLIKGGFSSSDLQFLGHQVNKTDQGMLVTASLKSQTDALPADSGQKERKVSLTRKLDGANLGLFYF